MSSKREHQRKFLILEIGSPEERPAPEAKVRLEDAYFFNSQNNRFMRCRIENGHKATIAEKKMTSDGREVHQEEIDYGTALKIIKRIGGITKHRSVYHHEYIINGKETKRNGNGVIRQTWVIDHYELKDTELIIAECHLSSQNEEVRIPPWIKKYIEITNHFTGYDIFTALKQQNAFFDLPQMIVKTCRFKRIVLDGAPCSGKTTIINMLKKDPYIQEHLNIVPEIPTLLILNLGYSPPADRNSMDYRNFQKSMYNLYTLLNSRLAAHAIYEGKSGILSDRRECSISAYLEGGADEYEEMFGRTIAQDHGNCDAVIYLELPNEKVYEESRFNNPARAENHQQALETGEKTRQAYSGHPNIKYIPATDTIEEKYNLVLAYIKRVLNS